MSEKSAACGKPNSRLDLRGSLPLLAACLLALALQLVVYARSPIIALDGIDFIAFARDLEQPVEAMRAYPQHPGYPFLIRGMATSLQAFGWEDNRDTWILAARLVAMLAGLLIVIFVWQITRTRYGLAAANTAALLCAAWPLLRRSASDALSDSPHLAMYLAGGCCFCLGLERRRWWWFAAAGACAGLAYWIRPEGLSIVLVGGPFLALWAVGQLFLRNWRGGLQTGGWAVAAVATALVVIAPYFVLIGKFSDKISDKFNTTPIASSASDPADAVPPQADPLPGPPLPTTTAAVTPVTPITPIELSPPAEPPTTPPSEAATPPPATLWGVPLQSLSQSLGALCTRYFERAHLLAALAGLALVLGPFRMPGRIDWYLVGLFAFHALLLLMLFTVAGYIDRRHVIPLVVLTCPLASHGLTRLSRKVAGRFVAAERVPRFGGTLAGGVLAIVVLASLPRYIESNHYEHLGTLEAVRWANEQLPAGAMLVTNSRYAPFYLSEECRPITLEGPLVDSLSQHASPRVPCYLLLVENQETGYDPRWWDEARLMGSDVYHTANTTRRQEQEVTCWEVPVSVVAQLTGGGTY